MKKHIIILFFNVLIFPGSSLFAQPGKGDINVTMRGSIYKLQNQTGVIANVTDVKEQHFSITLPFITLYTIMFLLDSSLGLQSKNKTFSTTFLHLLTTWS